MLNNISNSRYFEQSQTNLTHRLRDRIDIRTLKTSTTLEEVDCGKHMYIYLDADMTITLPNAYQCIGGQIKGFVTQAGDGTNTLTIATRDNQQLIGKNIIGTTRSYKNVLVGSSITATSSGKSWCRVTSGVQEVQTQDLDMGGNAILNIKVIENLSTVKLSAGTGANQKDLVLSPSGVDMGGNVIRNFEAIENGSTVRLSAGTGASRKDLVLSDDGTCTTNGSFSALGDMSCNKIRTMGPRLTFQKGSVQQQIPRNTPTVVSWPDVVPDAYPNYNNFGNVFTVNAAKTQFTVPYSSTYSVSWTIFWESAFMSEQSTSFGSGMDKGLLDGISGGLTVGLTPLILDGLGLGSGSGSGSSGQQPSIQPVDNDSPVIFDTWICKNNTSKKYGFQRVEISQHLRSCLQTVSIFEPFSANDVISIYVQHGAKTSLKIPAFVDSDIITKLHIYMLP